MPTTRRNDARPPHADMGRAAPRRASGWTRRVAASALTAVVAAAATALYVPAALAFHYRAQFGATFVYAEQPIDPRMGVVLARADRLLAASPINTPGLARQVVLTDGGWRWRVMAVGATGAFALRRPLGNVLVFNRHDIAADKVFNAAPVANERSLSGTIAHETTHMLITRHFGIVRSLFFPTWKVEGYADHVAGESSLRPEDEARVRATDPRAKALVYYEGRRRVEAALARNGGSVDRLFAE